MFGTCVCCEMNIYPIVDENLCTFCYYEPLTEDDEIMG